jgi:predicted Zn-dependent protease
MSDVAASRAPLVTLRDGGRNAVGTVDPETARRVTEVKKRMQAAAGVEAAELFIASGDEPNAFSANTARGRIVGINLAMLSTIGDDVDGYAAVLGHEYAHLALNHTAVRRDREQTRRAASNALGVVLGIAGIPMGGTLASIGTSAVERAYTRDEERDADKLGLAYMVRAGYDAQGAVRVWKKLAASSHGATMPFLATHPSGEERLKTLAELAEQAAAAGKR